MIGSDARKQRLQRISKSQACIAGLGLLAAGFLVAPVTPAGAQALGGIWDPDYVGGPPPIPPRDINGGRPTAWASPPPPPGYYNYNGYPPAPYSRNAPVPYNTASPSPFASPLPTPLRVSIAEMRRKASALGLHLVGTPHRQGRVYVAFAEDSHGLLHHLTFDAYEGTLTENEATTVTAKPVAHPASLNTGTVNPANPASAGQEAPHPATNSQSSAAQQTSQQKPVSPSSAETDQDLSPIKPKPGTKPPLPDDQIDKD